MLRIDARIPVVIGSLAAAPDGDALLLEEGLLEEGVPNPPPGRLMERFAVAPPGHGSSCACCVARTGAALALNRLFQARARGNGPFFRRVVVATATSEGKAEVLSSLRSDPLVSARFRAEDA